MQGNDQSRRPGRPSLLPEQPPPDASHSILSKLDGRPNPTRAAPARPRPGRAAWFALALAVGGGAFAWLTRAPGLAEQAPLPLAVAPPQHAAAPLAPALAASAAPVSSSPAPALDDNVSAAAILQDTPQLPAPAPTSPATGRAPASGAKDELMTLLDAPPAAKAEKAAAPRREVVKVARVEKTGRKEKEKSAARESAPARDKARAVAAKKAPAAKPAAPVDTDVALLAALLAHTKKAPASAGTKAARELKRCAALGSGAADKCRERLCAGESKGAPECKAPRVAKAAS